MSAICGYNGIITVFTLGQPGSLSIFHPHMNTSLGTKRAVGQIASTPQQSILPIDVENEHPNTPLIDQNRSVRRRCFLSPQNQAPAIKPKSTRRCCCNNPECHKLGPIVPKEAFALPPLVAYGKLDTRARKWTQTLMREATAEDIDEILEFREKNKSKMFVRKAHLPASAFNSKTGGLIRDPSIDINWNLGEANQEQPETEDAVASTVDPAQLTPLPEPEPDPVPASVHQATVKQLELKTVALQEMTAKHDKLQQELKEMEERIRTLETEAWELKFKIDELLKGSVLSYEKLTNDPKLQRHLCDFTSFTDFEAMEDFLDYLNDGGVCERLILYNSKTKKAPDAEGDKVSIKFDRGGRPRSQNWKDDFLVTMVYLYSGG